MGINAVTAAWYDFDPDLRHLLERKHSLHADPLLLMKLLKLPFVKSYLPPRTVLNT